MPEKKEKHFKEIKGVVAWKQGDLHCTENKGSWRVVSSAAKENNNIIEDIFEKNMILYS